ncbi:MAG: hypothetical protein AAF902_22215 [Chloroflexota bacterium]
MRQPYMIRTAIVALVATVAQIIFLYLSDSSTLLWGITILGQVAVLLFAWFQLRPDQALPVWLFECRSRYVGAAIPHTVWALLTWRGLGFIALIPLTVGLLRFGRYLYTYRDELQAEPNTQQYQFVVLPLLIYTSVLALTFTLSLVTTIV